MNVTICNLKSSTKGVIRVAIFIDEQGFKDEKDFLTLKYKKSDVKESQLTIEIPVKAGIYGICVLDDENESGKMEYNLLRIPKEGFGLSNFKLKKLRKPKFNDFSFEITDNEVKDIQVIMKYL